MALEKLQCPFVWNSPIVTDNEEVDKIVDCLVLMATPWHRIVQKIHLACSESMRDNHLRARQLVVECYLVLLPGRGFDEGCPLLREYGVALKYLVDSVWAWVETMRCVQESEAGGGPDPRKSLQAFFRTIPPYKNLAPKQKSALQAIRSHFENYPDNFTHIRKAIDLNPVEGQWHCWLGSYHQKERKKRALDEKTPEADGGPSIEELNSLKAAVALRRNPQSCGLLALAYMEMRNGYGFVKGTSLMKEALAEFPDSPFVLDMAGQVYTVNSPYRDMKFVEECYEKALKLTNGNKTLRMLLAASCLVRGDFEAMAKHIDENIPPDMMGFFSQAHEKYKEVSNIPRKGSNRRRK